MKQVILSLAILASSTTVALAQNFSIPIEGNGGYIDFHEDSRFKDAWYVGGSAGIDFTENAGIRGYYWEALDDGKIEEFDDLKIYGAETKIKVPISKYAKPYLVVGGGILDPHNNYVDANGQIENDDHFFGSAGAGLDLKFIRFVSLTGYARAMFSDFNQVNTLDNDVKTSWNYGASLNFNLFDNKFSSKKETETTNNAVNIVMPEAKSTERSAYEVEKEMHNRIEKQASNDRIAELERRIAELEAAKERETLRRELREELKREYRMNQPQQPMYYPQQPIIQQAPQAPMYRQDAQPEIRYEVAPVQEESKKKIDELNKHNEELAESIEQLNKKIAEIETIEQPSEASNKEIEDLRREIRMLESEKRVVEVEKDREYDLEMARLRQQLALESELQTIKEERKIKESEVSSPIAGLLDRDFLLETQQTLSRDEFKTVLEATEVSEGDTFKDRLFYTHTNGFLGAGFGDDGYGEALLGVKPNFFFAGSKFRLAPEASIGFGDETSINVLANALYDLNIESQSVKPYVGAGAGFIMPNGDFKPAINIAAGTQIKNVLDGKLSAEFAGRNLFKYNQLSVGYEIF